MSAMKRDAVPDGSTRLATIRNAGTGEEAASGLLRDGVGVGVKKEQTIFHTPRCLVPAQRPTEKVTRNAVLLLSRASSGRLHDRVHKPGRSVRFCRSAQLLVSSVRSFASRCSKTQLPPLPALLLQLWLLLLCAAVGGRQAVYSRGATRIEDNGHSPLVTVVGW